jgi:hypothetical protein
MPKTAALAKPTTVDQYLANLPADRREAISAIRAVILKNLDADYEEGMQYGMIGYYVPHRIYPAGYHCDPRQPLPFAILGSMKNHMALHLMPVYASAGCEPGTKPGEYASWFKSAWLGSGKKLDMGKACIRFKKLDDVPLNVVGEAIRKVPASRWIRVWESLRPATESKAKKKPPAKSSRKKAVK